MCEEEVGEVVRLEDYVISVLGQLSALRGSDTGVVDEQVNLDIIIPVHSLHLSFYLIIYLSIYLSIYLYLVQGGVDLPTEVPDGLQAAEV